MHEEMDAALLARYLHLRSGDMARRLKTAKLRVEQNADASMKDWKFHDECVVVAVRLGLVVSLCWAPSRGCGIRTLLWGFLFNVCVRTPVA